MTTTRVNTATATNTITVSANDVRQVMRQITDDIQTIYQAAAQASRLFDMDAALLDVSILLLNGIIRGVHLMIEVDHVIIREYHFQIVDAQGGGVPGLPAGNPPLGYVPDGARIRLGVTGDPTVPEAERKAWYSRLGWADGPPLTYSKGISQAVAYGTFQSGGLGVERSIQADPAFDRK